MKITFALLLIFCLQSTFAYPPLKGVLYGIVTDAETGLPISDANIYISDIKSGAATNEKGEYKITSVAEGTHLVEVTHLSFTKAVFTITVAGNTQHNIVLSEFIIENEAVVVTGVGRASTLKKTPFQVSVLKQADLQQLASTNIIDAIAHEPGVSALSTGPAISKPFIRGLGYNRVLTLNDGVRQEGQQWGDEHGIEIDDNSVARIELLKGPASLIYGSDAVAGVVNIITNVPVPNNTLSATAGYQYQTNSNLNNLYANVAGNKNGLSFNLYGTDKKAGDYKNKYDGKVFNSKFVNRSLGGYVGLNRSWGYSHLLLSSYSLTPGLIEGDRNDEGFFIKQTDNGEEVVTEADNKTTRAFVPFQKIDHKKIALDNSFKINKTTLSLNIAAQENLRQEFGELPGNDAGLLMRLRTYTQTLKWNLPAAKGWKPALGLNLMQQQNSNEGEEQLIPNYRLQDVGLYAYTQKEIDKVTLSGGIRFDNRNLRAQDLLEAGVTKNPGFEKSFQNFSSSLGTTIAASKTITAKLNLSSAFRAPGIPELASFGAHEGTNRFEIGSQNLRSETNTQADAGLEIVQKHITINLGAFYNRFNNFIFYQKVLSVAGGDSLMDNGGELIPVFNFDQRKAHLTGFEINFDLHPHPIDWLHFENSFSFVSGKFDEAIQGTFNMPLISAPRYNSELRAMAENLFSFLKHGFAKIEWDKTFAQNNAFTAFRTETRTPGYGLLHAGIGADVVSKKGRTIFHISVLGSNLTDKAYQNHLSRLKYAAVNEVTGRRGVFNTGRNFSIRLNLPLQFKLN